MERQSAAPSRFRIILAGLVGNVMEWYDFAVYGYFAAVIGHLFFPAEDPSVSLFAAFGAFAAGFLVRPLGGLVFGRIGDLVGRRRALILSVIAMAVPTVLIGFLPTYETIGVGQWFRYLTGIIEVGSAILLFIPGKQAWGAALLVCTMIGAVLAHLFFLGPGSLPAIVLGVLSGVVLLAYRNQLPGQPNNMLGQASQ